MPCGSQPRRKTYSSIPKALQQTGSVQAVYRQSKIAIVHSPQDFTSKSNRPDNRINFEKMANLVSVILWTPATQGRRSAVEMRRAMWCLITDRTHGINAGEREGDTSHFRATAASKGAICEAGKRSIVASIARRSLVLRQ